MNPEDRETLFTIAEVSVAVAGFARIVSVLASRSGRDDPGIDSTRLRIMLFTSLSAISLSFVPALVFRFGVSSDSAWRLSGAALLLGTGIPFLRNLVDFRSLRDTGVTPSAGIVVTTLGSQASSTMRDTSLTSSSRTRGS